MPEQKAKMFQPEPTEQTFSYKKFLPTRNQPCFCNSGLKFKNCCLNKVGHGAGDFVIDPKTNKVLA